MKQYIVFDMDGVLFDSEQLISRCWKEVGAKMGLPHIYETFLDCVGTTQKNTQAGLSAHLSWRLLRPVPKGLPSGLFRPCGRPRNAPEVRAHGRCSTTCGKQTGGSAWPAPPDGCWCRASWKGVGPVALLRSSGHRRPAGAEQARPGHLSDGLPHPGRSAGSRRGRWRTPTTAFAPSAAAGMRPIMVPDLLPPTPEMRQLSHIILPDLTAVEDYLLGCAP